MMAGLLRRLGIIDSVRGKLVLYFLLFLVIPLSVFTYIQYSDERAHIRDSVVKQLSSVADSTKRAIEDWINERTGDLSLLSTDPETRKSFEALLKNGYSSADAIGRDVRYRDLREHLLHFIRHIGYSGAALIDAEGRVLVSTDEAMTGTLVKGADYFTGAVEAGPDKVFIKDVYLEDGTDNPTMAFSQVVERPGGGPGILGVAVLFYNLDHNFYTRLLDWPGKGRTGETLIVRREGGDVVFLNRLKHVDSEPTTFKIPVSQGQPVPAIESSGGGEGTVETSDYRGEPVIAAYRYIPVTKWGFVAKIDSTEAFMAVRHFKNWTLIFIVFSGFMVAVLIYFLSRRIIEPIVILAASAKKIARGDFTVELPAAGSDEIGELTNSFGHMASELKTSNEELQSRGEELEAMNRELKSFADSLEEKVRVRTHELEAMNLAQAEILSELDLRTKDLEKSKGELREFADRLEESRNRVSDNLELVERANVELRRIDYMKDQFLGIISHELRTPLSLIMGYASNLLTNPHIELNPAIEEEVEGIYKGADRLKDIISEMLDISKIDAKGLNLSFENVDVAGLIREVVAELEPFVKERKQVLDVGDLADLPEIPMDRRRVAQVLLNVVGNAIKFTPDGGNIRIQAYVHTAEHGMKGRLREVLAEHLDIVVRDTGIGLDKKEIENIFDKFYEVGDIEKHTTSKYRFLGRGVGLGLPIARGIVEAHGGWLWAESDGYEPEKCPGSSFHIMLPLKQQAMAVQAAPAAARREALKAVPSVAEHEESAAGERTRPVVLMIEDDLDLVKLTEFIIKEKYDLYKATDGVEGLRLARELHPDLILLDVYMDGLNGYDVCMTLKNDPATMDITIAMFTAGVQKWEIEKGFAAGADDYITKPFKPVDLLAKIDDLISGRMALRNNSVD